MKPVARFTLTEVEWETLRQAMRVELIELAKQRRTITYGELALLLPVYVHPGSYAFSRLLGQVCAEAEAAGEGLLCALVVSKATGMPGAGYFRGIAERGCTADDVTDCWRDDLERVFERWSGA